MKRILAFILAAGLLLCACGSTTFDLSVVEDTVTQTGLSYKFTVSGTGKFTNDPTNYYLEHNVGGAWVRVDGGTLTSPDSLTTFSGNGNYTFSLDWSARYGVLEGGLYRLHKTVNCGGEGIELTADFQIITGQ